MNRVEQVKSPLDRAAAGQLPAGIAGDESHRDDRKELNGNLHIPEYTKRRKGIAQLYCEGVAMVCEHILCGDNDFWHQDKDGWLDWCYKNENQIKREYLRRLDKKESVQDFFGDWSSYNGHSDVGYFLGCRFIRHLIPPI